MKAKKPTSEPAQPKAVQALVSIMESALAFSCGAARPPKAPPCVSLGLRE
jgi:hypothetical protein